MMHQTRAGCSLNGGDDGKVSVQCPAVLAQGRTVLWNPNALQYAMNAVKMTDIMFKAQAQEPVSQ